ncbi:MAG: hypothetical protein ACQKBT_03280, partial [Puniceicoccales bacterium]
MLPSKSLVKNWNELRAHLNWAYDGEVRDHFRHSKYRAEGVVAWFIRKGAVTLEFAHKKEHFGAGCWIFPKDEAGQQHFEEGTTMLSVCFQLEWKEGTPLFERSRTLTVDRDKAGSLTSIGERLARLYEGVSFETMTLDRNPQELNLFLDQQRLFYGWLSAFVRILQDQGLKPVLVAKLDERVSAAANIMDRRNLR